ncbi:MAG: antibiotic biosynthesis monooxygenase [Nitrospirae bacterium]|nr:antibiotic biosynthesis monooxygenase [Nitrospirota bacterium]MBF0591156.1 antibiotic biosynthesis monooxygenase [Nitrospirota bacterium]
MDDTVTIIVSWKIKPGREKEFEAGLEEVIEAAKRFEGHQGVRVQKPDMTQSEYVIIFRFNNVQNLKRWEDSDVKRDWLRRAEAFKEKDPSMQKFTGLEFWFKEPGTVSQGPPRYKMVIVTVAALSPLIMILNLVVAPVVKPLPVFFQNIVMNTIMVSLLTYLVMPAMTRLLSFWLFDNARAKAGIQKA